MISGASIQTSDRLQGQSIQQQVDRASDELLNSFPDPAHLSTDERRGIIARYAAVLEGNFIYWMTATYLSVSSEEARSKILDNLREEVRDCHPGMMRRFAMAAHAAPTDSDALDVYRDLTNVRLFLGRLSAVPNVLTMAFFEGFIQKFMPYLAELAVGRGSVEREYTDVHGVCDVTHTEELFCALAAEMALNPSEPAANLFEGIHLLSALIQTIVHGAEARTDRDVYTRQVAS
jgi:Iron-containing redox enzyme